MVKKSSVHYIDDITKIIEYCIYGILIGAVVGFAGTYLGKAIGLATNFRSENTWIIYFLPLAGLLIVLMYKLAKTNRRSHNKPDVEKLVIDNKLYYSYNTV